MENILLKGCILLVLVIVLDSIWFSLMKPTYQTEAGKVFKTPQYVYAISTYVLLIIAALYFTSSTSLSTALTSGALLGVSIYGVYNLTNLTIIAHWTPKIALIDTLWGTIACTLLSYTKFLLK